MALWQDLGVQEEAVSGFQDLDVEVVVAQHPSMGLDVLAASDSLSVFEAIRLGD